MTSFDRDFEEQLKEDVKILLNSYSSIDNLPILIDKVKNLSANVDQAPSKSMQDALLPSMKALVANELFSCILHYWDYEDNNTGCPIWWWANEGNILADCCNIWKFVYLSHVPNCYYMKEVSNLDIVAKVWSCLVMLDLECDALIVEMFQIFFKIIRSIYSLAVFSAMETIMSLEKYKEISLILLSPLLASVKKEIQKVSPILYKLGEQVITKINA